MKHRGEHWTQEELLQLEALYKDGMKIADISLKINRSENAISKKIKELYSPCRRIDWTDSEIEKLKELHSKGLSYKDIADKLGKTQRACQGKAVRIGLKTKECNVWKNKKRADFWTESEIKQLEELIENGLSAKEISEKLNRSIKSLFCKMGELKLHIKEKNEIEKSEYRRVYKVDDDYFENIDTQKKAYFLGWLITDGYIGGIIHSKRGVVASNRIGLKIARYDSDVVEEFKKELKTDIPIQFYKGRISREYENKYNGKKYFVQSTEQCGLDITSAKMKKDLSRYGVYPHKTYTVKFPKELCEKYYPGFIAGVISGDGSVDIKNNHNTGAILRCSIAGTLDLLNGIQKVLVKNICFNPKKNPRMINGTKNLYSLELSKIETVNLYYWLKDNGIGLMFRKNKIIEDYLENRFDLKRKNE